MEKNSSQVESKKTASGAVFVAAGILLSRVAGFIRLRVFAHYFGSSDAGDAFMAAMKIPNFLQNLFGEGVLSASFIPVYASLMSEGKDEDARKVAGIVATVLALTTSLIVLICVLLTPHLIDLIAPGFTGEKRDLTIRLVQIFFPGVGLLVMSAWCLGVLNSHRRFFLSYAAPVLWNLSIIVALLFYGPHSLKSGLAVKVAWGNVFGCALQFLVQIPTVWKLLRGVRPGLQLSWAPVRTIARNFAPVVISRGVVQVSAYIDNVLASFLPTGAVSALGYAQTIYLLPVSLFGMSVSAAELPAMSGLRGSREEIAAALGEKLNRGLSQISYFIVPSVAGFLFLGDVIAGALLQTGEFNADSTRLVWTVLAGSTIGLLAATQGRLYSSAFYALKDTRTPLLFAVIRVVATTLLGYLVGLRMPVWLGLPMQWGTAGLTASAGLSGWIEFILLRRALNHKLGLWTGLPLVTFGRLWLAALMASAIAYGAKWELAGQLPPVATAFVVLGAFGVVYLLVTWRLGFPQARQLMRRFKLIR